MTMRLIFCGELTQENFATKMSDESKKLDKSCKKFSKLSF
jgi:hypothetical protein